MDIGSLWCSDLLSMQALPKIPSIIASTVALYYPSVPFHQLKNLHEAVKDQLPPPYKTTLSALREVVYALGHQAKDENFFIQQQLPQTVN